MPPPGSPCSGRTTVLLAEDEAAVRELVAEILETAGYSVLQAENGLRAVEVAEAHATAIQLLVSDVVMPAMTGVDLARRLRVMHPGLAVLLMSGYSDPNAIAELQGMPRFSYLRKPFSPNELIAQIATLLQGG